MSKKLYIENMQTPLTYKEAPKGSNALGRLEGVGGSWKESTRNNRLYDKRLWENVINSESFKEGMETRTIFAEANHPEERIDIDIKEVAGVLTDLEILDNGDIYTAFDILPTPNGKIVKTLLDYGCKIGVSSRGLGDEIIENGVTKIDPDTYEYYCHDFVVTPAVKKARPEVVENKESKTFISKIDTILSETKTKDELQSIKRLIESTNISEKHMIVESIDNKISSLSESADNQGDARDEVTEQKEEISKLNEAIQRLHSSIASKDAKIEKLQSQLKRRGKNAQYFRKALQEQRVNVQDLESAAAEGLESISSLSKELNESLETNKAKLEAKDKVIEELRSQLAESQSKSKVLTRRCNSLKSHLDESKKALKVAMEENEAKTKEISNLVEQSNIRKAAIDMLTRKVENLKLDNSKTKLESKELTESNHNEIKRLKENISNKDSNVSKLKSEVSSLTESLESHKQKEIKLEKSNDRLFNEYIKKSCQASNLEVETVMSMLSKPYTIEAIDKTISKLSDRQRRFDMLPLSMPRVSGKVVEHNVKTSLDDDDVPAFVVESLKRGGGK